MRNIDTWKERIQRRREPFFLTYSDIYEFIEICLEANIPDTSIEILLFNYYIPLFPHVDKNQKDDIIETVQRIINIKKLERMKKILK